MATPITDPEQRLRDAGFTEPQARAIASGFEILNARMDALEQRLTERMDALEHRVDRVELWLRIVFGLQVLTLGLVLAPYVAALFNR
jgi:hypothetical protein